MLSECTSCTVDTANCVDFTNKLHPQILSIFRFDHATKCDISILAPPLMHHRDSEMSKDYRLVRIVSFIWVSGSKVMQLWLKLSPVSGVRLLIASQDRVTQQPSTSRCRRDVKRVCSTSSTAAVQGSSSQCRLSCLLCFKEKLCRLTGQVCKHNSRSLGRGFEPFKLAPAVSGCPPQCHFFEMPQT